MPGTCYLRTNSLLKIRFPSSLTQNHWVIEEKQTKAIYAIPLGGILMAIICLKPTTQPQLFEKIVARMTITQEELTSILEYLVNKQIIFRIDNPEIVDKYFTVVQNWSLAGWYMATHYHFFTRDAPYIDYSKKESAFEKVTKRMLAYHTLQSDVERCKKYTVKLGTQPLPSMRDILISYGFSTNT